MHSPVLLLSTIGTSLLSNAAGDRRGLLFQHANAATSADVPDDARRWLQSLIDDAERLLEQAEEAEARRLSAELNGLLSWIRESPAERIEHELIATDTWLGRETARLVEGWLRRKAYGVHVRVVKGLQTRDFDAFRMAITELLGALARDLPAYKLNGYGLVFNLTGGFKGVNGFLQTAGSLYADEIIYMFERTDQLLRIPRIPVSLDAVELVEAHMEKLRRLDLGLPVDLKGVPELLVDKLGEDVALSPIGKLLFEEAKQVLFRRNVRPAPSATIFFGEGFERTLKGLSSKRCYELNTRLGQLARYAETGEFNLKSLDLKALRGSPKAVSTHELDAWSDGSAKRIYLHQTSDSSWVLDELGAALH